MRQLISNTKEVQCDPQDGDNFSSDINGNTIILNPVNANNLKQLSDKLKYQLKNESVIHKRIKKNTSGVNVSSMNSLNDNGNLMN